MNPLFIADLFARIINELRVEEIINCKKTCKAWLSIICDYNKILFYANNPGEKRFINLVYISKCELDKLSPINYNKYNHYLTDEKFYARLFMTGMLPAPPNNSFADIYIGADKEKLFSNIFYYAARNKDPVGMYELITASFSYICIEYRAFEYLVFNWRRFGADFIINILRNDMYAVKVTAPGLSHLITGKFPRMRDIFKLAPNIYMLDNNEKYIKLKNSRLGLLQILTIVCDTNITTGNWSRAEVIDYIDNINILSIFGYYNTEIINYYETMNKHFTL